MANGVKHTHYLDRVMRVFVILITIILSALTVGLTAVALSKIGIEMANWLGGVMWIVVLIISVVVINEKFMNTGGPFNAFSAYLYVKIGLGIGISFKDARYYSNLFVPNQLGVWWPMKDVKKISKQHRKLFFTELAEKILSQNPSLIIS